MPDRHRWTVDALDDAVARVEEDGERVLTLSRWMLPPAALEGDVLTVVIRPGGRPRVTLEVAVDRNATRAAHTRSTEQVDEIRRLSGKRDRGGSVEL